MTQKNSDRTDEVSKTTIVGHILIRDKDTKEVLLNQREDAVHQKVLGNSNAD